MPLARNTSLSRAELLLLPRTRISSCPHQCLDPFVKNLRDETVPPCDESEASLAQPTYHAPSTAVLERLSVDQRSGFLRTWNRLPPHMREITFDLHGPGWTPAIIIQLGEILAEFSDVFSKPQQNSAPAPCFPSIFRFLRTALPSRPGPTASILRPPRKWTRFSTNPTPRASSSIRHHHGRAQWLLSRRNPVTTALRSTTRS